MIANNANSIIEQELDTHIKALEEELDSDVLTFSGKLSYGADDVIRDAAESIQNKRQKLTVVLETTGGYIEVVQRMVVTLRRHYPNHIGFIIPNYAMSAGTVFVMSGDVIYMDYYSILGPIDPQVGRPGGTGMIPALGYLVQYERLIKKSQAGTLSTAEMTFLIEKFDPAELYRYEQARDLSISLLKEWLVKYKFKTWDKTETRQKTVTKKMKSHRAAAIARLLNKTQEWHSHGRGISMEVLRRKLNLRIEDFGSNANLDQKIKIYHKLLVDYMMRRAQNGVAHTRGRYVPLGG